jgi:hypothetical protein
MEERVVGERNTRSQQMRNETMDCGVAGEAAGAAKLLAIFKMNLKDKIRRFNFLANQVFAILKTIWHFLNFFINDNSMITLPLSAACCCCCCSNMKFGDCTPMDTRCGLGGVRRQHNSSMRWASLCSASFAVDPTNCASFGVCCNAAAAAVVGLNGWIRRMAGAAGAADLSAAIWFWE